MKSAKTLDPLAVDLDGTLIKTDSLIEMFIVSLLRLPWLTFKALLTLFNGKAAFKKSILDINLLDIRSFPIRADLLNFLHKQKEKGRKLFLVTAADQKIADEIANKLDIFETASGSSNGHNLKGKHKLKYLQEKFPNGFSYAGDSSADILIWEKANSLILVGASKSTQRAAESMDTKIEQIFPAQKANLKTWIKALRIHQWSKNALLFVPLALAHKYTDASAIINVFFTFLYMGLIASGTYLINDLSDLNADRKHKTKKNRAIASGAIGAGTALIVALAIISIGLIGAISISISLLLVMLTYLTLTLSYSFYFKKIAMLDVVTLGSLYSLRIIMGTIVISAVLSPWLLIFSLFFFLSLSLAKRYVEIIGTDENEDKNKLINGRGYMASDSPMVLAFGVATSTVAVLILTLYVSNDAFPVDAYNNPQWLWFMTPIILLWIMRIWLLSHRGQMHDDPVSFAIKDKVSWGLGALVGLTFIAAIL